MDNLIILRPYGSTCYMRLYADKIVTMASGSDFKRLVSMIVGGSDPRFDADWQPRMEKLKHALKERKLIVDNMAKARNIRKADLSFYKRQLERRTKTVEDLVARFGYKEVWERL